MKVKLKNNNKHKKSKFLKELKDNDDIKQFISKYLKDNSVEDYLTELTKIILRRN